MRIFRYITDDYPSASDPTKVFRRYQSYLSSTVKRWPVDLQDLVAGYRGDPRDPRCLHGAVLFGSCLSSGRRAVSAEALPSVTLELLFMNAHEDRWFRLTYSGIWLMRLSQQRLSTRPVLYWHELTSLPNLLFRHALMEDVSCGVVIFCKGVAFREETL